MSPRHTPEGFTRLSAAAVLETVRRLDGRIRARFPQRHLGEVCHELAGLVEEVATGHRLSVRRLRVTTVASRALAALVALATVAALALAVRDAARSAGSLRSFEWLPVIESTVNDVVFAGLAILFLYAVPARLERRATLALLHRLRSLAHVIDMHQLTKDPERLRPDFRHTEETVDIGLDAGQLASYLDYCSEMLSLVAKAAALCAEDTSDDVVLGTVSTIENLTTGMSRKIWQKISLLRQT